MLPLITCLEEDQRERLFDIFQEDFQNLNTYLAQNGFSTCEYLNLPSFSAGGSPQTKVSENYEYPSNIVLNNKEEVENPEEDYFYQASQQQTLKHIIKTV